MLAWAGDGALRVASRRPSSGQSPPVGRRQVASTNKGSPRAKDRPVTKRSRRRASLGSTGTCVSRSIRSTFLFGRWFLEHLSPGSDDTLMPGTVSPRSAAGSSVVAVWVNRSPAPFAVFPSAASGQTQPAPQSTKEFGIAQAECVGGGDGGQPSASVRPGARTQAGPPGKRALPRGASKSNEEGLVLSLFQHPAGTALPPASVFVGASLIPVLIGRQNAAAQQVPGRHGLKALIAQEPRGLIGPADQGARITWLSGLLVQ